MWLVINERKIDEKKKLGYNNLSPKDAWKPTTRTASSLNLSLSLYIYEPNLPSFHNIQSAYSSPPFLSHMGCLFFCIFLVLGLLGFNFWQ